MFSLPIRNFLKMLNAYFIAPRMHYLLYVTLALMGGISCQFLEISFYIPVTISLLLIISGKIYHELYGDWHLIFFFLAAAYSAGVCLCYYAKPHPKNFQTDLAGKKLTIQGTVVAVEHIQNPRFKYRILLDLHTVKEANNNKQSNGTVALYVHSASKIHVADYIEIENVTFKEVTNTSFNNYLAKEKIIATLFLESFNYTILQSPSWSLRRFLFYLRENTFKELRSKINRNTFQLFSSIFLGNRTAVKKQMEITKEPFKIWGTSHYLARSGLHLVIFVIVWHFILSLIPISFLIKQIFLTLLILIYATLSWSSVSFERALLMFLIYKVCLFGNRPSHYVHLVVLVTFIVLCHNPLQLFFLDFQLSFGLTFALAWFNHIEAHKKRIL